MTESRLQKITIPDYTRGEEIFNMTTHIVGGAMGIFIFISTVVFSILKRDTFSIVSSIIYGLSMVILYTASSVYHGLVPGTAKKIMRVIDHCTIYFLIAGTYTPIALCSLRSISAAWGWTIFAIVWALAIISAVFTAVDMNKYKTLSMCAYLGMGWCIIIASKIALRAIPVNGLLWLLTGGIFYTVGALLYSIGKRRRYIHSIFHIFVVFGSFFQYLCIFYYVIC